MNDFEDYQIEIIDLTSITSLEAYKNETMGCFPKLIIHPIIQHFSKISPFLPSYTDGFFIEY